MQKKEVTKKRIPQIKRNTPIAQQPTKQKIDYRYAGKENITELIAKAFPKQLIPTKRMGTIFGIIFVLILLLSVLKFPLSSLISGTEVSINVGYPLPFLEFGLTEEASSPIRIGGLIIDLILYIILAYIIDVIITLTLRNPFLMSKKEAEKYPTVFKDQKPKSISETITKKVFEKESKKPTTSNPKPHNPIKKTPR